MSITIPAFYPKPWAADETLVPLTPAEMAMGYPSGSDEKPSRQSINNALQYAVNGVLYYMTTGIPAWSATATYQKGAIVTQGGRYYASLFDSNFNQPPGNSSWTELLWTQSVLDARYALMNGSAAFSACQVAKSPVRTFANSPDNGVGGGMQWPPAGISVSTGTAWDAPIDPAMLVTFPPTGIAVSTGSAWDAPIDPASFATWPQQGIAVSTGSAWATSLDPATLATFPAAGVAVSKGAAWDASLDLATLVLTTGDSNINGSMYLAGTFGANGGGQLATVRIGNRGNPIVWQTGSPNINGDAASHLVLNAAGTGILYLNFDMGTGGVAFGNGGSNVVGSVDSLGNASFIGHLNLSPNDGATRTIPTTGFGLTVGWNVEQAGRTNFVNVKSAGVGGFSWYNMAPSAPVISTTSPLMILDQAGSLSVTAGLYAGVNVWAGTFMSWGNMAQLPPSGGARTYGGYLYADTAHPLTTTLLCCGDGGSRGNFKLNGFGPGGMTEVNYLTVYDGLVLLNMGTEVNGTLKVDSNATVAGSMTAPVIALNVGAIWYTDGGSTFLDGAPGLRLIINNAGGYCAVNGTFTVNGTKTFSCQHPLDESQELIHACLEGPENGVFYRGEVVLVDGAADVTLPDYFEPLTFIEDRSVLLTQIDDDKALAMLAASRIIDGKFHIRSSVPDATVAWEVKAVRRIGVERLAVAQMKYIAPPQTKEN